MSVTLANGGAKDRRELDYYPTPSEVTIALMLFLKERYEIRSMSCHEPACGDGRMSEILKQYFKTVISTDIRETGYGEGGVDYLIDKGRGCTCVITNPPFSDSQAFIEKALSESKIVAMLLKSQYWHSSKRRLLFVDNVPAYVLPLTWRPDFYFGMKSGSPTMEVLWTVWDRDKTECIYYPLKKPTRMSA